jgi:menaquinone-dependent protoporphyrinogen oxidase
MPATILVTYATRYGSTREVAEAITALLHQHGLEVDLRPLREVENLADYQAVVVGAALYMGRLHKEMRRFLARQRAALTERPVAVFALGPVNQEEKDWEGGRTQLHGQLAQFPWLKPVALELFGGRFDPALLRFPWTLLPALKKIPASDARDWAAIRAWASTLPVKLRATSAEAQQVV